MSHLIDFLTPKLANHLLSCLTVWFVSVPYSILAYRGRPEKWSINRRYSNPCLLKKVMPMAA